MTQTRRPSAQAIAVLTELAADPTRWRYGYELGQRVRLKTGSLYPILIRLSGQGLLESSWEADPPVHRPARHLYRLTGTGLAMAAQLARDLAGTPRPGTARASVRPELRAAW